MIIVSKSEPNPYLSASDTPMIASGGSTFADNLTEYAGRVCYRSTAKMGHAPSFVQARMREGHEDIAEHAWVSVSFVDDWFLDPSEFRAASRYFVVDTERKHVSGNARTWLLAGRASPAIAEPIFGSLKLCAPSIFAELPESDEFSASSPRYECPACPSVAVGDATVTLLGANLPSAWLGPEWTGHDSASFLIEGVSRALTH